MLTRKMIGGSYKFSDLLKEKKRTKKKKKKQNQVVLWKLWLKVNKNQKKEVDLAKIKK